MSTEPTGSDEIRRFEEQYRRNPDSLVFARLADGYRKAGDADRALQLLDEGIRRHRDYPSAYIIRARTFIDLGRAEDADAAFRHVLELDAQNLVAMRGLAELAEDRGDRGAAAGWYEGIVALDPLNAEAADALLRLRDSGGRSGNPPFDPEMSIGAPAPSEPAPGGIEPLEPTAEEWWTSSTPVSPFEDDSPGAPDASPTGSGRDRLPDDVGGELEKIGGELDFDGVELPPSAPPDPATGGADVDVSDANPGEDAAGADGSGAAAESSTGDEIGSAWWFEDPGETDPAEDGDLLTRTMADLYARQGLVDEATAIYRELLVDRPGDPDLERALAALQADVAGEATGNGSTGEPASVDRQAAARPNAGALEAAPNASRRAVDDDPVPSASGPAPAVADSYASHEVPAVAGQSEVFLEWLRRLE